MGNIITLIIFILVLSVIIIIHEFGHLIAAKHFGVYCKEFSIGMGPVLVQKQGKETAWSIRALPIGGFVAMAGEEGEDEDDDLNIPYERTINGIKPWKQIVVMAAGAIMNILLAWVIFVGLTAYQGVVSVSNGAVISSVVEESAAEKGGLQAGDEIIYVQNGEESIKPESIDDVSEFIQYYKGDTTFTILRDGEELKLTIMPTYNEEQNVYQLGVYPQNEIKEISFLEAIPYGTQQMIDSVVLIIESIGKLVQGIGLESLSGPVGIYQVTAQVSQAGLLSIISFIGLLSVNVGIFNLLPIPILDGGRIFIVLIEAIIGRKLSERVQNAIMMAGLFMIVGLMVFATWNDIVRLF